MMQTPFSPLTSGRNGRMIKPESIRQMPHTYPIRNGSELPSLACTNLLRNFIGSTCWRTSVKLQALFAGLRIVSSTELALAK